MSQVPTSLYGLLRIPVAPRSFYPSTIRDKKAVSKSRSASKRPSKSSHLGIGLIVREKAYFKFELSRVKDVSDEVFSKMFLRGCVGGCGDFEIELRKIKIREHALKLAERLSETKSSCSLPISVFNMFPDFVIFLVLWSGAEAANIFPQNTSSIISYG